MHYNWKGRNPRQYGVENQGNKEQGFKAGVNNLPRGHWQSSSGRGFKQHHTAASMLWLGGSGGRVLVLAFFWIWSWVIPDRHHKKVANYCFKATAIISCPRDQQGLHSFGTLRYSTHMNPMGDK